MSTSIDNKNLKGSVITVLKNWIVGKFYQKPSTGIPKTDLNASVQTSLNDADSALQPEDVVDNVTTTTTNVPLSANMGKELNDRIDNLEARGKFLSLWRCDTGLPTTNPTTSPYYYKTGDYYIVKATSTTTTYRHAVVMSGVAGSGSSKSGNYSSSFNFVTTNSSAYTTIPELQAGLIAGGADEHQPITASGTFYYDETYNFTITGIMIDRNNVNVLYFCSQGESSADGEIDSFTTLNDTVTVVSTGINYRPNGSSYTTGVASTTVEQDTPEVGDTYYYDGTNWTLQKEIARSVSFAQLTGQPGDNGNLNAALMAKANSVDLSAVATSGSYNDLSNRPSIPTVNDGTVLITRNDATTIGSFTLNQTGNTTITLPNYSLDGHTHPTVVLTGTTEAGAVITLSLYGTQS